MTNARAARAARAASGAKTAASKAKNNGGTPRSKKPEESPAGLSAEQVSGEEAKQLDAVLCIRLVDEAGKISVVVQTSGDVRATEVDTLLKMGYKNWQAQIGV
jgi:hypothetical protein